jgi:hypothetical protein
VVRQAAGLREHSEHILERLLELRRESFTAEALSLIPADLTGDENETPRG